MPFASDPAFTLLEGGSVITEIALHLVAHRDGRTVPMGTAVVIGSNVAITARHVVEACWSEFEGGALESSAAGTFALHALQVMRDGKQGVGYSATKTHVAPWTDLALLELTRWTDQPPGFEWWCPKLALLPPAVGTRVAAFGYHGSSVTPLANGAHVLRSRSSSVGTVTAIHLHGRDRTLPWSCFETNMRFESGMSGGPVFDDDGRLCGLVCSSMPPGPDAGDHVSWVTSLWPMMGMTIDTPREGHPAGVTYPVLELARAGLIHADGWERVSLEPGADGRPQVALRVPAA